MAKNEKWPKHKMGKHCGYELFEDGSIQVAPSHSDRFELAADEQRALDEFLASIARVSQGMADSIAKKKKSFWRGLEEDYGIDLNGNWTYSSATRRLVPPKQSSDLGKRDEQS